MKQENHNREIEVRFLDIDKNALIEKLHSESAQDLGEDMLYEIIFYDKNLDWQRRVKKFVRVRKTRGKVFMTFKDQQQTTATGVKEIEFEVENLNKAKDFLEAIDLVAFREQEKRRHTFMLDGVTVDIDTWPSVPTYVEFEGPDEESLKRVSKRLGFNWSNAIFELPRYIIEKRYGIPVSDLHFFTFSKIE